jgi:hypothetical protein
MNRPPLLMRLRIHNRDHKFGLWLPLFLLIPVALVVFIILSPLILLAVIILWPTGWGKVALLAPWYAWCCFCATRGLNVDVQGPREIVKIAFI